MKKIFTIVLTLALLTIAATAVLAADDLTDEELIAQRHAEMVAEKQEWLADLVAQGVITQEEADQFIENMEQRYLENDCTVLGAGINGETGFYRGGRADEDRGMNEDGILQCNLNEDGVLYRNLNEDGTFEGGMGMGNGRGNGGFGQAAGYDGDCILD